jgi:DNA-binding HxlR family transcriptional regulator
MPNGKTRDDRLDPGCFIRRVILCYVAITPIADGKPMTNVEPAPDMAEKDSGYRSPCPLSTALEIIGDKWSLLIIRDMCLKKHRFGDFQSSPEAIPTNILANRLRYLETCGIIKKSPYQSNPPRYEYKLTAKGADLIPVMQQLALWAEKHIPECDPIPEWFLRAKPTDLL